MFTLAQNKHSHPAKPDILPHSAPTPEAGVEESGELKDFVDNYLTLADKALGFVRRPGPNAHLTISTCTQCQHTIAATSLKLLAFAENLHVCPARPRALVEKDAA